MWNEQEWAQPSHIVVIMNLYCELILRDLVIILVA